MGKFLLNVLPLCAAILTVQSVVSTPVTAEEVHRHIEVAKASPTPVLKMQGSSGAGEDCTSSPLAVDGRGVGGVSEAIVKQLAVRSTAAGSAGVKTDSQLEVTSCTTLNSAEAEPPKPRSHAEPGNEKLAIKGVIPISLMTAPNHPPAPLLPCSPAPLLPCSPAPPATHATLTDDYLQPNPEDLDDADSDENQMAQVTSVSQLTDVKPTDWAIEALRSLVERYGCMAGYPDATYRGNRSLTRYEFAAGLNTCLDKINKLLAPESTGLVRREDLATLQRLREEFATELAALRGRVDKLEARTATLEAHQFSTTTKLSGITVVGFQGRSKNRADLFPRDGKRETDDRGRNIDVIYLNQLYLTTQLDKRSYLFTGLLVTNGTTAPRLTNDVRVGYEFYNSSNVVLSDLNYHFLIGDKLAVIVGTEGVNMVYGFRGPNRVESAATGPLSVFAQRNPILNTGFGRAGIGIDWQFAKRASLQALYSSNNPGIPGVGGGLFNGHTTAGVQLALTPADPVDVTLYYVNDYSPNGNLLHGVGDDQLTAVNPLSGKSAPLRTNAIGATVNWQITPRITLGGWFGYTNSYIPGSSGNVNTTNYMAYLNFPDLFGKGNLAGLYVGQPPKIVSSNLPVGNNIPDSFNTGLGRKGGQPGTTTHIEAFYRLRVTDNISITPGVIFILKPGHTPASDPITIGILRTTFTF